MKTARPIPRRLLPDNMLVFETREDGTFRKGKLIRNVRFEREATVSDEEHRADTITGTIYVDAMNTRRAYEIPVGSRIEIGGMEVWVKKVERFEGTRGKIHHWELSVQ